MAARATATKTRSRGRGPTLTVAKQRKEPHYAALDEVKDFAQGLPERYLYCREMGHNWKPQSAGRWPDRAGFSRILRCMRCRTERHQEVDSSGNILSSKYIHPEGYLHVGMGRIIGEGRGILRLESITRITEKKAS